MAYWGGDEEDHLEPAEEMAEDRSNRGTLEHILLVVCFVTVACCVTYACTHDSRTELPKACMAAHGNWSEHEQTCTFPSNE